MIKKLWRVFWHSKRPPAPQPVQHPLSEPGGTADELGYVDIPPSSLPTIPLGSHPLTVSGTGTRPPSPVESKPGELTSAHNGAKTALEVGRQTLDTSATLNSVTNGLTALLNQYHQSVPNKDDVQRLVVRVGSLATSFTEPSQDIKEVARRTLLENNLGEVLGAINELSGRSSFSGSNNADQLPKITGLMEDIRDATMDYQTSLQQDRNEEALKSTKSTDIHLLNKLPYSLDAEYNSGNRDKCLRGTRVKVLETIENWVYQNKICRVYWLNGAAGSGKTTIARSLAERMFAEGLLGASFFCSCDFPDRRDLHFIFPTLAFQLAQKYPAFRADLVKTLMSSPDSGHGSLEHQLNKLVVEPLQSTGLSTVIIIDALDECEDDQPASAILSLLSRAIDQIPSVKFFITGRPESQIRSGFRLPALRPQTEILLLHKVEPGSVDEDIRLFLEYHLKELAKSRRDIDTTTPWPAPEDVQIITSKAGGLFIYASTVIKFVASDGHLPRERLQMIISLPDSSTYEGRSGIDPVYTRMFEKSCAHIHHTDSNYFSRLRLVISSVVLMYEPISVASLATLLGLDLMVILNSIRSLHSVLLVPDSDSRPIRVFHKSFSDYITDHDRCKDLRFYVDSPAHHARLTAGCFELMETGLKTNICNLPQYAMNEDIEDLSVRREELIGEALVYACRFWSKHLCSASRTGTDVAEIVELLKKFLARQLLQWLEVLSILNDLRGVVHSLTDAERWIVGVKASDEGLLNLIRESRRFALYSFDLIQQSAAHIYDSALLWPPATSPIRTLYEGQLRSQVKLLNGIDSFWDACIRAIPLGGSGRAESVFSPRGDLIVGCTGTVVKILEATTGVCLATLHGHNEDVNSVAFSPDGMFLVSGSYDSTVKVWDVQTGAVIRTLEGHAAWVLSAAFSPTGTMVASGSHDGTIRIWNVVSGHCDRVLKGHSRSVRSVCWLQINKVVSGSKDGMVKMWDIGSGECLKTFDKHSDPVWSVTLSPDLSTIVSGSEDRTIQVYDSTTGDVLQTVSAGRAVYSVCFSPNGDRIVYATAETVVVWDLGMRLAIFESRQGSPSAAFSPDGDCVTAGSWDGFVRVFQIEAGYRDVVDHLHSKEVRCVAFSKDGQMIASGSNDTTVKVWDVTTGSYLQSFHGHSDFIRSVAFSPDTSLIAFASDDHTVRIYNLQDHSMIRTLEGHWSKACTVKFSPDGRRMVSVSALQDIILWDVEKWEQLAWLPPLQTVKEADSRVSFSADGARVRLELCDAVKRWNILSNADYSPEHTAQSQSSLPSSETASLPMVLVPTLDATPHESFGLYRHPIGSEWILDQDNRRVCWIPADRRCSDSHGQKVTLGTTTGRVVIVDFSQV